MSIQPNYDRAVTDIRETKKLAHAMMYDKAPREASVDERVQNLSDRMTVLHQAKQHLENDVNDISAYYDKGAAGFFRRIADFFTGSPIKKAQKEIKQIDTELSSMEDTFVRLNELNRLIQTKLTEVISKTVDQNALIAEKFPQSATPSFQELSDALAVMPDKKAFLEGRLKLESKVMELAEKEKEIARKQAELKALTGETTGGTVFGKVAGVFSDQIRAREERIDQLKGENLDQQIAKVQGDLAPVEEALASLNEQLPEKFRPNNTMQLIEILNQASTELEKARELREDNPEYQAIQADLDALKQDLERLEAEKEDLV